MVTLTNADKALKTFYLGVLADQLNVGVNPLLAKIGQTGADVWGKEVRKLAPYGINGGIGSGSETDSLPLSGGNNYAQFTLTLKNLFGRIEISDKAVRASQNSAGAFVNLLNAEMDGLLKASKFNFGRMLYGDGSGLIATTVENVASSNDTVTVDSVRALMEGMTVDVYNSSDVKDTSLSGARILGIDRDSRTVKLSASASAKIGAGYKLYVQGSKGNEITGLEAVFGDTPTIYGLNRSDYSFLKPYVKNVSGKVTPGAIQSAVDVIEEVADGTVYLLNSEDFKLHQLCDWRWLEGESGSVLHQIPGKASYSATLVKYADLLCARPMGQAKLVFDGSSSSGGGGTAYYTVTFDSDGGTSVDPQIVLPGGKAVKPADPTKTSLSFMGWELDGEAYDFTDPVNSDITLTATWL